MRAPNISLFSRVIGGPKHFIMRAPNISLFPRVIDGSKHFIIFKGYRRTV